jgi:hypothetical protein
MANDPSAINDFIHNFYGYGNLKAKYWFIGMEEGGGNSEEEFNNRIKAWQILGEKALVDVAEYHEIIGINRFFKDPVKIQSTWNKLIRIYLSANGLPHDTNDVRVFQKNLLGRSEQDTSLMELLPLSSPNSNVWLYPKWTDFQLLKSRDMYRLKMVPLRLHGLKNLIKENQPSVVVFYGLSNEEYWKKIIPVSLIIEKEKDLKYANVENTLFLSIKHPVAKGLTNEYFQQIGEWIHYQKFKGEAFNLHRHL